MVCSEVRPRLLAAEGAASADVLAHVEACGECSRLATALGRLDGGLRSGLVVAASAALQARLAGLAGAAVAPAGERARMTGVVPPPQPSPAAAGEGAVAARGRAELAVRAGLVMAAPAELQARLAGLDVLGEMAGARAEQAVRSALVVEAPAGLRMQLTALANAGTVARIDEAVRSAVIVETPVALQARLLALAPADGMPAGRLGEVGGRAPSLWAIVRARPAVFAGQLAALAVLAYAVTQVATWLGTLPVVLGDVPYALELLVLSPAVDYLGQIEGVVQQLGLWLLVAAAGWLLAQGLSWRQREPTP